MVIRWSKCGTAMCWHFAGLHESVEVWTQECGHKGSWNCCEEKYQNIEVNIQVVKIVISIDQVYTERFSKLSGVVRVQNKISWIFCGFQLFMHLIPFTVLDNLELTLIQTYVKRWHSHVFLRYKDLLLYMLYNLCITT